MTPIMNKQIQVMVVEDNHVYLQALVDSLNQNNEFNCIANASSSEEAISLIRREELRPDVILLDLELPGAHGLDALPTLLMQAPGCHIIVLTQSDRESNILEAISRGASGYLLKTARLKHIFDSIGEVNRGGASLDPKLADTALKLIRKVQSQFPEEDDQLLTVRELEVLQMLSEGLVKKEIANQLGVSIHAIDKRMRRIYNKLQVQNVASAVAVAIRSGWI